MSEYIDDIQLVLKWADRGSGYVYDANPRLRYAALSMIGQVAEDHKDEFTNSVLAPKIFEHLTKVLSVDQPIKLSEVTE